MSKLLAAACLLSRLGSPEEASDWPQWRGAAGDGLSHGTPWSPAGHTVWSAEIGLGYSAPSVSQGRVLTFGFDVERSLDVLRCLDEASGRELWRAEAPGELRANQHEGGTLSTPAIGGELVYVHSTNGVLSCYRLANGELVWRADLAQRFEVDPGYYGFAGSPVLVAGHLLLTCDRVVALDPKNGETQWKSEPLGAVYSTAAPCEIRGQACAAVLSQQALHLFERASGRELGLFPWHKSDRLVNAATPVVIGERLFVSSAYEHGCALVEFGADGPVALFENKAMRNKMAGCVQLAGCLFGFDESVLKCLDLAGNERWRLRGLGNGALAGGDGKLAVLSSSGELVIATAASSAFEELTRVALFEQGVCWTPPVIAGGRLYCRNNRGTLVCRDHRRADALAEAVTKSAPPAAAPELPDAAALFARHLAAITGGGSALEQRKLRLRGTYEQRSVGFVPVAFEILLLEPDRRRVEIHMPPPIPGVLARVFDGERAFERNAYRGDKLYSGSEEREEALAAHPFPAGHWQAAYRSIRTTGVVEFGERSCFAVEAITLDGARRELYFERDTGLLAGRAADNEAIAIYSDYREFEGLKLAAKERYFRPETGIEETFRIEEVERLPADFVPDPTLFERGDTITKLLTDK